MQIPQDQAPDTAHSPATIKTRTPLYLDNGVAAEIVSFNGLMDEQEHIALLYPPPTATPQQAPLVRIHSECLTGDVFGSAHCDCGDQLHEAQKKMVTQGGILLYLRQEGRGIGLYNKIDAYKLQHDKNMDTFTANRHLGFEDDLRNFSAAAAMLKALGVTTIRLLTNNPDKVKQIEADGITVTERVPTGYFEKKNNSHYLQAKKSHGHRFSEES